MINRISISDFIDWEVEFWKRRESRHVRMGQAFLNENFPMISDSKLFYAEDKYVCRERILNQYVSYH